MGISKEISNYINRAIDNIKVPEDFMKHTKERKIPMSKRRDVSIEDIAGILEKDLHDRAKDKHIKEMDLQFLSEKGTDYVKAWHLHFILDYLSKLKDWMKNTGESIEDCIDKYQKNKAVTVLETEKQLVEVMNFLKRNSEELQKDIYEKQS
ncbi:MAG: hypothetical protein ACTSR2_15370 [Candidatus Hodarchaeales archaeon]